MRTLLLLVLFVSSAQAAECGKPYWIEEPTVEKGLFTATRQVDCTTRAHNTVSSITQNIAPSSGIVKNVNTNVSVVNHIATIRVRIVLDKPWYAPTLAFIPIAKEKFVEKFQEAVLDLIYQLDL